VHVCDFTTTQISSKYVDEHHTDYGRKDIEPNQFENRDVPCGGTHAQGTGGSRPTHGELLEVAEHSRCRKMYVVPSLERPPGSRRSRSEKKRAPLGRGRRRSDEEEDGKQSQRRSPKT
jgi:hypothetical protein